VLGDLIGRNLAALLVLSSASLFSLSFINDSAKSLKFLFFNGFCTLPKIITKFFFPLQTIRELYKNKVMFTLLP